MESALRQWPALDARVADFAAHVERLAVEPENLVARGAELYLAFACGRGDEVALRVLENEYVSVAMRAATRVNPAREFADEVAQALRERLFVGEHARILYYAGTGSLAAWLRVTTVRTALNLHKSQRSRDHLLDDDLIEIAAPELAPGEPFREAVQTALRAAFALLSPRERNVLLLSYVEARSIDQIAALYGTHRATAARWIAAARERIFDRVSAELRQVFGFSASEVQSALAKVRSQLEVSVTRLLGATHEGEPLVEKS